MRKILLLLPFFLWTCGGGSKSPTEPSNVAIPAVQNLSIEIEEDTPIVIELPKTNNSASGLTYSISTDSQYGSVSIVNGNATYTPNENYFGTDSFVFSISNGETTSSLATVSITITSVNDAPVVEDIQFVLGSEPFITLIGSDVDGDQITFEIVDNPSSGNISLYENEATYQGNQQDLFTYKANDGELDSNTGTVTLETAATTTQERIIKNTYPDDNSGRFSDGRQYGVTLSEASDRSGYLLAGVNDGAVNPADGYAVKVDYNFNQEWAYVFDTSAPGSFSDSKPTLDGGFILCGTPKVRCTKIDGNGNEEWTKIYGDETISGGTGRGHSVIVTEDNGYLISGGDENRVTIIKTDSNGNVVWTNKFEVGTSFPKLLKSEDGSFFLFHQDSGYKIVIKKIHSNGNLLWEETADFTGSLEAITKTPNGFVGSYLPTTGGGGVWSEPYLFEMNNNGQVVYNVPLNHSDTIFESIIAINDGFILSGLKNIGRQNGAAEDYDIFIIKTDLYGNQVWAFNYHDNEYENDYGSSGQIILDSDNNYASVGISWPESGNSSEADIAFIRIDSNGDEID